MEEKPSLSSAIIASWEGGYRCRVAVRDFELVSDEPARYGGSDAGPMPTELLLASLASCFTLAVAHAARKRNIELPDLTVQVQAEYDGPRFRRIAVEVCSSHPRKELEAFIARARSYCYVSNTLLHPPQIEFRAVDPITSHDSPPPRD